MEFCPKCENVFTYNENIEARTLEHYCNNCDISSPLVNNCLSTKTMKKNKQLFINYNEICHDKTIPNATGKQCNKCDGTNVCFVRNNDLSLTYICRNIECKNVF